MQDSNQPYGCIPNALLALNEGRIIYAGPASQAPTFTAQHTFDGNGQWATPGLIDCHTHLVFGGNRALEFEQRLQGISYEQIARSGGGINSTVNATREASPAQLQHSATTRLQRLRAEGVTTVEVKSGYGLNLHSERRMLQCARTLAEHNTVTIKTSFLGAHALPCEFKAQGADAYIAHICQTMLPTLDAEGLVDAVDVFCEGIGFSPAQCEQVFQCAQSLQLPIKAHVEQLSNLYGAKLAAEYKALSVDHLEYLTTDAMTAIKQAGSVAVILPAAYYFLQQTQKPPIVALREAGIAMAVASDLNPGSAPQASLLLAMNQAAVLFGLTPEECLRGVTCHAAAALGLDEQKGVLQAGFDADIALWDISHPSEISYGVNFHKPSAIWQAGNYVDPRTI